MKKILILCSVLISSIVMNQAIAVVDSTTVNTNQGRPGFTAGARPIVWDQGQIESSSFQNINVAPYFTISKNCPTGFQPYVSASPFRTQNEIKTGTSSFCIKSTSVSGTTLNVFFLTSKVRSQISSMNLSDHSINYTLYCYPPGLTPPAYVWSACNTDLTNDYQTNTYNSAPQGFVIYSGSADLKCDSGTGNAQCSFNAKSPQCPSGYGAWITYAPYTMIEAAPHMMCALGQFSMNVPGNGYGVTMSYSAGRYNVSFGAARVFLACGGPPIGMTINFSIYCVPKGILNDMSTY